MATQDREQPAPQPTEDMFGRPTSPRHDEPATRPGQSAPARDQTGSRKSTEEESEEGHDQGGLDDIPDGDGPRSDRGTNPLPDVYWADYPGGKP
jgi:hypothetical protein